MYPGLAERFGTEGRADKNGTSHASQILLSPAPGVNR